MTGRDYPIAGKNCLVMREASQAKPLTDGITALGGRAYVVPLISFRKRNVTPNELEAIQNLDSFHWIVFTSQNGVHYFMDQLQSMGKSVPKSIKIAAVGTKTEKVVKEYGIPVTIVPKKFTGDVLAEELKDFIIGNERMLIVKGNLARDVVGKTMLNLGLTVETVIIYETYLPEESHFKLMEVLEQKNIDILIFTSPSTVDNFVKIIGEKLDSYINGKWVASIGPVTTKALNKYGLEAHICPETYTTEQLLIDMQEFQYN